jgi:uncharacterized protein
MNPTRAGFALGMSLVLGGQISCNQPGTADEKNVAYLRAHAERGDARAQYSLGLCYQTSRLGLPTNYFEAAKWYLKAADQNCPEAQYNLGLCYYEGLGVAKDRAEAAKWCRRAADLGDADAELQLGFCYDRGHGVAQDAGEALKWYRKAAEQNLASAQFNLGIFYGAGRAVAKDEVEAVKWLLLAAAGGDEDAKRTLRLAEPRLTPEQLAESKRRANEFKPVSRRRAVKPLVLPFGQGP